MMATGEKRGTIMSGTVIAIALVAIGPLIATMKAMTVNQKAKDGPECRIGETRARVSHINYLNLIIFAYSALRILTINVRGLGTTRKRDLFLHELNENLDYDFFSYKKRMFPVNLKLI